MEKPVYEFFMSVEFGNHLTDVVVVEDIGTDNKIILI